VTVMPVEPFRRLIRRLLPLCLLALAACAKTGEPLPPLVRVPRPAADLVCRQLGDAILLSVSTPKENTDGSALSNLAVVELLRVWEESPPFPAPLAEDEFLNRAHGVFRLSAGKTSNPFKQPVLTFRDDFAQENRAEIFGRTFRYAVRFINKKNQTAGLSNQASVSPVPLPAPPAVPASTVTQGSVKLSWKKAEEQTLDSIPARVLGYRIYRSESLAGLPGELLTPVPVEKTEFEDTRFQFDRTYYYSVSIVGSVGAPDAESLPSPPLEVVTEDRFPPGAPQNLDGIVVDGVAVLLWSAPEENDVAGYRIYRSAGGAAKELLTPELVRIFSYRDERGSPDQAYEYFVAAVDTHGNEGPAAAVRPERPSPHRLLRR
jgi:hypothetical protein